MWKELLNLLLGSGLFITPKYFSKLGLGNTFIGFIIFSIYFGFLGWEFLKLKGNFLEYIKENVHLYIYQIILYCYMIITWAGTAAIISNASNYIPIKSSIIRKLLLLGLSFFNLSFIDIPANIIKIFLVFILPLFLIYQFPINISWSINYKKIFNTFPLISWCYGGIEALSLEIKYKNLWSYINSFGLLTSIYLYNFIIALITIPKIGDNFYYQIGLPVYLINILLGIFFLSNINSWNQISIDLSKNLTRFSLFNYFINYILVGICVFLDINLILDLSSYFMSFLYSFILYLIYKNTNSTSSFFLLNISIILSLLNIFL